MTSARIARIAYPVTTLGPGKRLAIWFQGCSIGCAGCASTDTWDADAVEPTPVDNLLVTLDRLAGHVDGLTITGGEPFEQPLALEAILEGVAAQMLNPHNRHVSHFDTLCFTGLNAGAARNKAPNAFALIDVVVAGPFLNHRRANSHPLIASENQELILRPDRPDLSARYASLGQPEVQVAVNGQGVQFVGLPGEGILDEAVRRAAARGVHLDGASWRPRAGE